MFLQVVVRDDAVEFSREPLAVLPNGITMQFAMDVENTEEAKRAIEKMLPTLKQNSDTIAHELSKIGELSSPCTTISSIEGVKIESKKQFLKHITSSLKKRRKKPLKKKLKIERKRKRKGGPDLI